MATFYSPNNITRINEVFTYGNYVTGGVMGIGLLMVIFVISFIAMRNSMADFRGVNAKVFAASSFITMIFSVIFFIMGIVNDMVMYICIVAVAVSAFANLIGGN